MNFCYFFQSYEQAFEKIKEATGITDIDKLVTKFIEGIHKCVVENWHT